MALCDAVWRHTSRGRRAGMEQTAPPCPAGLAIPSATLFFSHSALLPTLCLSVCASSFFYLSFFLRYAALLPTPSIYILLLIFYNHLLCHYMDCLVVCLGVFSMQDLLPVLLFRFCAAAATAALNTCRWALHYGRKKCLLFLVALFCGSWYERRQ